MAAPRNRRHILVANPPEAEGFTSRRSGRSKPFARPPDRVQHALQLTEGLTTAVEQVAARRAAEGAAPAVGVLVQFEAPPGVDLKLESLENKHAGIEVRGAHRTRQTEDQPYVETATVFIPEGKVAHFLNRFQQYANENSLKEVIPQRMARPLMVALRICVCFPPFFSRSRSSSYSRTRLALRLHRWHDWERSSRPSTRRSGQKRCGR